MKILGLRACIFHSSWIWPNCFWKWVISPNTPTSHEWESLGSPFPWYLVLLHCLLVQVSLWGRWCSHVTDEKTGSKWSCDFVPVYRGGGCRSCHSNYALPSSKACYLSMLPSLQIELPVVRCVRRWGPSGRWTFSRELIDWLIFFFKVYLGKQSVHPMWGSNSRPWDQESHVLLMSQPGVPWDFFFFFVKFAVLWRGYGCSWR